MNRILDLAQSDIAIIIYELIGIMVAVIVGNILGKKIKAFQTFLEKEEHDRKYSELDHALGNVRRR
jgi:hypothetical protein